MNKNLFALDTDVPPLLLFFLATISLIFNLCFPQYSVSAYTEADNHQEFVHDDELEKEAEALKVAMANEKNDQNVQESTYSELKLEPNKPKPVKSAVKVPKATTAASSKTGTSSKWVTVTAYSSTVDQCDSNPFVTASGTHVRDGIIATNLLAFGTKVKFPSLYGDKVFTVEDRMNQRYSNHADIWFETREQAKQFGVKKLEMVIVS